MLSNLKTFMMLMAYWKLGPWRTGNATSLEILGTGFSPCGALHGASSANFDAFPDFLFAAMFCEVHPLRIRLPNIRPNQPTATPLLPNPPLKIHSTNTSCSYAPILTIFIPLNLPKP